MVVLPTALCAAGGARETTASDGGVLSTGSPRASEAAIGPALVPPTALCGG